MNEKKKNFNVVSSLLGFSDNTMHVNFQVPTDNHFSTLLCICWEIQVKKFKWVVESKSEIDFDRVAYDLIRFVSISCNQRLNLDSVSEIKYFKMQINCLNELINCAVPAFIWIFLPWWTKLLVCIQSSYGSTDSIKARFHFCFCFSPFIHECGLYTYLQHVLIHIAR